MLKSSQIAISENNFSYYKKIITTLLKNIKFGAITLKDKEDLMHFGVENQELNCIVTIYDHKFYQALFWSGSIALGETYMNGLWETNNLTKLLQILTLNINIVDESDRSQRGFFLRTLNNFLHIFNKNNINGSRKNIYKHYDLGNNFFKYFLDPTMMYSSAMFADTSWSLEQGSLNKLKKICDKLELKSTDHLLEIGGGWGGLAIFAAQNYGCQVTTATISQEQYDYVLDKVLSLKLDQKIKVLKQDYRKITGLYDKLVSIEMIEAVGHQYFDDYFKKCSSLVKPNGLFVLQAITIEEQRYISARDSVDFIKKYIFPGCCIPSIGEIMKNISLHTSYNLVDIEDLTMDYAITLKKWHANFNQHIEDIKSLGFDKKFINKWQYYFSYCEAGFLERKIFDFQMIFAKPFYRPQKYQACKINRQTLSEKLNS